MTTPYRSDLDALREAKDILEKELRDARERGSQIENELRSVEERIAQKKRVLPLLDTVKVASPCNRSWDEMLGDDRVRFCTSCEKNVFNLSAMSREDAEALLASRSQGELCIRYYQRADGTVMTQDCPVGVAKKRRKLFVLAAAGAGAMAFAAVATQRTTCATMGAVAANPETQNQVVGDWAGPPTTTTVPPAYPETQTPHVTPPVPTPTVAPTSTVHHIMGRRVR